MNVYGDLLERAGRRFPGPSDQLDDLYERWRRRQRNRRVVAGVTGLVIFAVTAVTLGSRLRIGDDGTRPGGSSDRAVSAIVLGARDVQRGWELGETRLGRASVTLIARGDTQVLLQRLPLIDGVSRRFRSEDPRPFAVLNAFVLRFGDEAAAQGGYALLELEFRRGDGSATELPAPLLGVESIALEQPQDRAYRAPATIYLWRRGDLVMGLMAIGSLQERQLEELARTMDARAEREDGDG